MVQPAKGKKRKPATPYRIKKLRISLGMTQAEAAAIVHTTYKTWQAWEAGSRPMNHGLWELFQIRTDQGLKEIIDNFLNS